MEELGSLEPSWVPQQLGWEGDHEVTPRASPPRRLGLLLTIVVFLPRRLRGLEFPGSISTSASWEPAAR